MNFPKKLKSALLVITAIAFVSIGCNNSVHEEANNPIKGDKVEVSEEIQRKKKEELSDNFLGVYVGMQESYFMKNEYGDDMIVAGNKIDSSSISPQVSWITSPTRAPVFRSVVAST